MDDSWLFQNLATLIDERGMTDVIGGFDVVTKRNPNLLDCLSDGECFGCHSSLLVLNH
jgi:hypothetical protein